LEINTRLASNGSIGSKSKGGKGGKRDRRLEDKVKELGWENSGGMKGPIGRKEERYPGRSYATELGGKLGYHG